MKILFLDVDGVLNDHGPMMNMYCGIDKEKVNLLNRVLDETGCYIVISSARRYMILGGDMTIRGFEHMLLTHGLKCYNRIIGHTPSDEKIRTRGQQISWWLDEEFDKFLQKFNYINYTPELRKQIFGKGLKYVVVDDLDECEEIRIRRSGHPLIQTDGSVGLTNENCTDIIRILNE